MSHTRDVFFINVLLALGLVVDLDELHVRVVGFGRVLDALVLVASEFYALA